ncbi:hypothetical protein QQ045_010736 [Rhodiola kirilowii]
MMKLVDHLPALIERERSFDPGREGYGCEVEDASKLKPLRKPLRDVSNKKKSAIYKTAQKNTHSDDDYSLDRLLLIQSEISYPSPAPGEAWMSDCDGKCNRLSCNQR